MHAPDDLIAKLLKAWHFLYKRGFIEGFGHLSARIPDSDLFLLARHSMGPRATADDFLVVDMQGRKVSGDGNMPGEYPIHLEILKARPDISSVFHYHGLHSTAFTTSEHKLRPIHLMGTLFHDGIPIYDDPAAGQQRRARHGARQGAGPAPRGAAARARRGDHRRELSRNASAAPSCSRKTRAARMRRPAWASRSGSTTSSPPTPAANC